MQQELGLPIHAGARTALELQGAAHNIVQAARLHIILIASEKISVPHWVQKHDWQAEMSFK